MSGFLTHYFYEFYEDPPLYCLSPLFFSNFVVFFMQQGKKFTEGLTWMTWFLLVFWFDIVHNDIYKQDTRANTHIFKYILTPPLHTANLYCTEWVTCWNKNLFYRRSQCLSFSKITHLQKSYICWLDSTFILPKKHKEHQ